MRAKVRYLRVMSFPGVERDIVLQVRNMHDRLDREMSLPDFIEKSRKQPPFVSPDGA